MNAVQVCALVACIVLGSLLALWLGSIVKELWRK
jgi:hypothetical protein